MERVIEFKNFEQSNKYISADLYLDGKFVVRLSDVIVHIMESEDTNIGLYEYFRKAALSYMDHSSLNAYESLANNNSKAIH
ncbi:MAG: hypothetical protein LW807_04795 [Proteobacteria bacterium]|jgi:hypothetical protein|nr:hypothetical protein [Pseudomonadota bacterium]